MESQTQKQIEEDAKLAELLQQEDDEKEKEAEDEEQEDENDQEEEEAEEEEEQEEPEEEDLYKYRYRRKGVVRARSDRIQRALKQNIFFVSQEQETPLLRVYKILGTTNNLYTVRVGEIIHCDCPDRFTPCKHLLFIFLRVLKLKEDSKHIKFLSWDPETTRSIFEQVPIGERISRNIRASSSVISKVREFTASQSQKLETNPETETNEKDEKDKKDSNVFCAETKVHRRGLESDPDCPICYDDLKEVEEKEMLWCKDWCGRNFHKHCALKWKSQNKNSQTCPLCRRIWEFTIDGKKKQKEQKRKRKRNLPAGTSMKQGYLNIQEEEED